MDFGFYFGITVVIMGFVAWAWVRGIDRALRDFPDYRGEDLLDDQPTERKQNQTTNKQ